MEIKYTKCPTPTKKPCLMENEFGEIFLVTNGLNEEIYVTRINCDAKDVQTWEGDLTFYNALPKGTKVELIN